MLRATASCRSTTPSGTACEAAPAGVGSGARGGGAPTAVFGRAELCQLGTMADWVPTAVPVWVRAGGRAPTAVFGRAELCSRSTVADRAPTAVLCDVSSSE